MLFESGNNMFGRLRKSQHAAIIPGTMEQRKWEVLSKFAVGSQQSAADKLIDLLLENRGISSKKERENFLQPPDPYLLKPQDVKIKEPILKKALQRIKQAIKNGESIVVYADYDADGITAGTIMWETLHELGAKVMPYIPHRESEGYGLSIKGIDNCISEYKPQLIITVDHGITAKDKVAYAKSRGIDTIVTDHHVLPLALPDCLIVHTTALCGAGVAWFVAKELISSQSAVGLAKPDLASQDSRQFNTEDFKQELLALAGIGTIADMVPLLRANRGIAKWGLAALNKTQRVGLRALIAEAGITQGEIDTYAVSHLLAPRLNAMGRLVHAMDALRLLCTKQKTRASDLAQKLGLTNRERQQLTLDTTLMAKDIVGVEAKNKKLLFIVHSDFNPGIIGLVAGKLVEAFYRPTIVVARGETVSRASARSIAGFNIVEAIRSCRELLIDVGGHPMAAGFTVETQKLELLKTQLEALARSKLDAEKLTRRLKIDLELPLELVTDKLWKDLQILSPFGMSNPEPVFATRHVKITDMRLVGREGKHIKIKFKVESSKFKVIEAIGFGMGELYGHLRVGQTVDIAYTLDMNEWNGDKTLQLKIKDIHL